MSKQQIDIKPIETEEEHEEAIEILASVWDAKEGTEGFDRLDLIATLIDDYEKKKFPIGNIS